MSPGERQQAQRPLLGLDPELGQLLDAGRREAAEHELFVRVSSVATGEWDGGRLAGADPGHVGLLIHDGVMAREVVVGDTVSTELLGPGDVVRPWQLQEEQRLLQVEVRWNALSAVRFAILDRRLAAQLGRYPEVNAVLIDRLSERAQRLAVTQAISQLNRVDRRLVSLFWHLAERWGRVVPGGVAVPLAMSHRLLGQLVGARRPTVSTALADLAREKQLERRPDGTWLLTGDPVGVPVPVDAEVIRQRRRLVPALAEAAAVASPSLAEPAEAPAAAVPVASSAAPVAPALVTSELRASVAELLATSREQGERLRALCDEASALCEHLVAQRERHSGRFSRSG